MEANLPGEPYRLDGMDRQTIHHLIPHHQLVH